MVYSILFKDEDSGQAVGEAHVALVGPEDGGGVVVAGHAYRSMWMGRKFWSRFRGRPVGGCLRCRKKRPLEKIYEQIEEELRNQYALGYTPDKDTGGGCPQDSCGGEGEGFGGAGAGWVLLEVSSRRRRVGLSTRGFASDRREILPRLRKRQPRRSGIEKQKRRIASLGMTSLR